MRGVAAALAATLVLSVAGAPAPLEIAPEPAAAQEEAPPGEQPPEGQPTAPREPAEDGGGDDGGVPIWAGIGLILLAAVAGSLAARARNRRRMREFSGE